MTEIVPAAGISANRVLALAAALERQSEHPLAGAVVRKAEAAGLGLQRVLDFVSIPGEGVRGVMEEQPVLAGSRTLLETAKIQGINELDERFQALQNASHTVIWVAAAGEVAGLIAISDPIKPTTPDAIESLHGMRLRVVMLTGDNHTAAERIARQLGIDEVHAEVTPGGKQAIIEDRRRAGEIVAMAGDGVNDAPALAAADVGIAMGTGTDVAIQSAGITLMKGDLRGVVHALRLSRATMRNIRQNLVFAFLYNALGIPIAAGALYPAFGILLDPIIASGAMSLSSLSVVVNALRLRKVST